MKSIISNTWLNNRAYGKFKSIYSYMSVDIRYFNKYEMIYDSISTKNTAILSRILHTIYMNL
jgi:hypothetical protein